MMIKAHPYADAFPMMKAPALAELAIGIKKNGQRQPGVTVKDPGPDGEILLLDGRNRQAACKIAGVKFKTVEYEGDNPLEYVLDMNLRGRHLTVQERAEAAAKLATMTKGQPKSNASNEALLSQTEAAEKLGVSRSSVQRAAKKAAPPKEQKTSWTIEELKEKSNEELMDCFTAIAAVYGNDDTRAIRTGLIGLNKADVLFLAKLPRDKMLEIQDLIMAERWAPKKLFDFLNKMLDEGSTIEDLILNSLATKGKFWEGKFRDGAFTVTCRANRAIERKT